MSEAMDGRREAHREVLVAVFGQKGLMAQPPVRGVGQPVLYLRQSPHDKV